MLPSIQMSVGDNIRRLRLDKGLSQPQLATLLGVTKGAISQYENDQNRPSTDRMISIATILGVEIADLLSDSNVKDSEAQQYHSPYNGIHRGSASKQNMWWVPAKAEAGFLRGFATRTFPHQIERGSMPFIQGECFGFEIDGFSMFPNYMPGNYVVCTTLEDSTWLKKGKVYVFQTADGLIIKFFDRVENDKIYMLAANNNYNPVEPIPVSDLIQLYNIEFDMAKPKH